MTSAEIRFEDVLAPAQAAAVRRLVERAPDVQDSPALSDRAVLNLSSPPPVRHLVATDGGELIGYAQLTVEGGDVLDVELVTRQWREPGEQAVIDALLERAIASAGEKSVRLWAHGAASPAHAGARRAGLQPTRSLLQLRRELRPGLSGGTQPLPAPPSTPPDVEIRAFQPGTDDAQWLRVNAAAFASHPEQGSWTQRDLDARIAMDWFDPTGFLVAHRGPEIVGFHWTKVHRSDPPIGEVYVLGVDPRAQGLGLGKLLLIMGLAHLQAAGLPTVMLYVESDNTAAVKLYESLGFHTFTEDVQYTLLR